MKKRLKDVCDFYSGTGFPTQYQGETEGEYPFYKVGDIANNSTAGKVYLELCNNYISTDVAKIIKGCILPKDTVVFAKIGEALKLNRRAITSCNCLIDNNAMGIAPKSDFLRIQYFYFFMKNLKMQLLAESTTVPSVRKTVLEDYEIEVPTLEEQKEIEKKLALTQEIIEKRKQELAALDDLIKARFFELFGDPNDRSVPAERHKIGGLCDVTKLAGFEFTEYINYQESGEIIMLRGLNCKQGKLVLDNVKYIDRETSHKLPRSRLYVGDILMTYAGTIGDVAMVDEDDKYHLAPNVAKISINEKDKVNPTFLVHLFMYSHDYIMTFASQVAQASINMQKIRDFEYVIPSMEEQLQFEQFAKQVDKSKVAAQKALDEAQLLFDSLMQKYFG